MLSSKTKDVTRKIMSHILCRDCPLSNIQENSGIDIYVGATTLGRPFLTIVDEDFYCGSCCSAIAFSSLVLALLLNMVMMT